MRMVQHAKMISLGRMSAGIIHEINNPLNYVNGAVQILRKRLDGSSPSSSFQTLLMIFNTASRECPIWSRIFERLRIQIQPTLIQ